VDKVGLLYKVLVTKYGEEEESLKRGWSCISVVEGFLKY
jgi:hypothetical protein